MNRTLKIKRTTLTDSERKIAGLLLQGVPGCRGILVTGTASVGEAAAAYEWLEHLSRRCTQSEQGAIDALYFALSLIEQDSPKTAVEAALAA